MLCLPTSREAPSCTLMRRFSCVCPRARLSSFVAFLSPLLLPLQRPVLPLLQWLLAFLLRLQLFSLLRLASVCVLPLSSRALLCKPRVRCLGLCLSRLGWEGEGCLRCTVCLVALAWSLACLCLSSQFHLLPLVVLSSYCVWSCSIRMLCCFRHGCRGWVLFCCRCQLLGSLLV